MSKQLRKKHDGAEFDLARYSLLLNKLAEQMAKAGLAFEEFGKAIKPVADELGTED